MRNLKNLTLVSMLIATAGLGAQEAVGSITGTVRDANGAAVAGASIRITGQSLLTAREATTDANGRYRVQLILPGQCTVTARKQGFIGARSTIMVNAGSILTADFVLKTVSTQMEEVEVVGNADPITDKTETKIATTFNQSTLNSLPTSLDATRAALYFAPGVSGREDYARIRGNTSGQMAYTLNGISMRDPAVGQGRTYDFSMDDMVQDVQVTQNPINAKLGFTSSGSVNVVTKTGTNKFEGSVRMVLSNSAWRTYNSGPVNNRFSEVLSTTAGTEFWTYAPTNPRADVLEREFYVTIMGPIWKDRITFAYGGEFEPKYAARFTLFNPLSTDQAQNWLYLPGLLTSGAPGNRTQGPNPTAAGNPMADNWGSHYWVFNPMRPADPYYMTGENAFSFNMFKAFFQITPDHQLEGNYSKGTGKWFGSNMPDYRIDPNVPWYQEADRTFTAVNYRGMIGSSGVLTATWGKKESTIEFPNGPDDPVRITYYDSGVGGILDRSGNRREVNSGGATLTAGQRDSQTMTLDYNHIWEGHNIDIGVQQMSETVTADGTGGINKRIFYSPGIRYDKKYMVFNLFATDSPYQTGEGFTYTAGETFTQRKNTINSNNTWSPRLVKYSGSAIAEAKPYDFTTTSFYANDNWTLNDHWAFNIGVRLDKSVGTDLFEPISGPLTDTLNISPRLRAQYDLFGDNRHVFNLALTQSVGALNPAAMGADFAHSRPTATTQTYFWDKGGAQPTWVDLADIKVESNYGYYYSYTDGNARYQVDPNLRPERTQQIDLQYKRVFDNGGFFSMSINANRVLDLMLITLKDEVLYSEDPSGNKPQAVGGNAYPYWMSNKKDRDRHYVGAEIQWRMPLVHKPTYRLDWDGNWTIAKTTGNWAQTATGQYGSGEGYTIRTYERAIERLGIDAKLFDPWGELNNTPRHTFKTWLSFIHGERGGIINDLRLSARYVDATYTTLGWALGYPDNLYDMADRNLFPRGIATPPASVNIYPFGRSHRKDDSGTYNIDFQWNFTIPIKGTLQFWGGLAITNVFNSPYDNQPERSFTNAATRYWTNKGDGTFENQPELTFWLGKRYATYNQGQFFGTYRKPDDRIRGFNTNVEFGLRF